MKKILLITVLLTGGFLFTSYQSVEAANAVEVLPRSQVTTILASKANAFMQRFHNVVGEIALSEEEIAPGFTCSYGHENCVENHRECMQGHLDCTIQHGACEQGYTKGTHQRQGNAHGGHQGNAHHRY